MDQLLAVSPIDGRYHRQSSPLSRYFSEEALIRYRVRVEVLYFLALCDELPQLKGVKEKVKPERLHKIYQDLSLEDAKRIKEIESVTNHDVKAVEYFLKEQFDLLGLTEEKEFIHFGLTSQDINNTSFPMMQRESLHEVYLPQLDAIITTLKAYAEEWADIRTHSWSAS